MSAILAIDQSTSATKALLFDTEGYLLDRTSAEHRQYYPKPGWVEHDAEAIYQNTLEALRALLEKQPQHKNDVVCLSITNQRETFVVFERSTGKPLYNAIVWQCRRGETLCEKLIQSGHSERIQALTGLKIDTYFPASKISWLCENEPSIRHKLLSGEALLGTIDTYLIYRLTGCTVFATDQTNASRTLLYDIGRLEWNAELCELFGVPPTALADVRDSSAQFGTTNLEGLLDRPIPICGVMGDSQAALFAERCFFPGTAKVTFGTGSSVLLNIGQEMRLSNNGIVTTIGWHYQGVTTYAFEGIINFTGATIAWLQDQLKLIDDPRETQALAEAVPDNAGVYLVPAFVGLSAPYWQPNAKAAIVGLTPAANKNHIVRAALESIAYQVKDVLDLMSGDAGIAMRRIQADGGMVNNQFLMQFCADMTQFVVRASTLPELSALGAVFAGALGMDIYRAIEELESLELAYIDYTPHSDLASIQALYAGWQAAVQRVL
ncbi:MAG: glycerol kinase GlpK [Anaerolineaceae bacterium]|nr:glycerol kinase GlpK [Anaerolineaceae bacterium]